MYTDEQKEKALREFERAKSAISDRPRDGDKKGSFEYARAYQVLVKMKLAPQLKGKYRP